MFTPRDRGIPRQPRVQPQQTQPPAEKPVICTEGTFIEKMNEAIKFSEEKRKRVTTLGKIIGDKARSELIRRHRQMRMEPPSQADIDTKADSAIEADARWRLAVADEQWGYRLTTMYGIAELVAAQREANDLARRQLAEQRTTNDLLRMLSGQLSVPTGTPEVGFRGPAYDEPI